MNIRPTSNRQSIAHKLAYIFAAGFLGLLWYACFLAIPTTREALTPPGALLRVKSPAVPIAAFVLSSIAVAIAFRRPIIEATLHRLTVVGVGFVVLGGVLVQLIWMGLNTLLSSGRSGGTGGTLIEGLLVIVLVPPLYIVLVTFMTWFMPVPMGVLSIVLLRWIGRSGWKAPTVTEFVATSRMDNDEG